MQYAGWDVAISSDDVDALVTLCSRSADLVVLHAPANTRIGAEQLTAFREAYGLGCLPVLVLLGQTRCACRCFWLDSGADDVIDQSASGAELASRIRALMRFKIVHDELDASRVELARALQRQQELHAEVQQHNEHLQTLCRTDPLTHVANVRSFRKLLDHEFKIAKRYDQPLSLLTLDVDHFKVVNDTHGHPSGDYVLKELAVILKQSVRESDIVARVGGEEFAVVLPRADAKKAERFAQRVRREVFGRKFEVFGREIHVTVSIGSATWPSNAEIVEPDMLRYFADQALLRAKEEGRDRVVAVSKLDAEIRNRLRRDYRHHTLSQHHDLAAAGVPGGTPSDREGDLPDH